MNGPSQLPRLGVADFGPGREHVAEAYHQGQAFAILHKDDPARPILARLQLPPGDPYTYVFVHGGQEVSRFENMAVGTHEIPDHVVASLLRAEYGIRLNGLGVRMCTCYGNLLRPGDVRTLAQGLAGLLPGTRFEAYHGLILLDANPPAVRLGRSIRWDATGPFPGPVIVGPPGPWETVIP